MWIVAGLGNPGKDYEKTRHNLGFLAVEEISRRLSCRFKKSGKYQIAEGFIGTEKVILVKPLTFMNLSGHAVSQVMVYYKCEPDHLIVIHDDLDIDPGRIKIRVGGGSGGHKGIDSIIHSIHDRDFIRVKIGIGKPESGDTEGYVLGKIGKEEKKGARVSIERSADAVEMIIDKGISSAMNIYNAT